MGTNPPKRGTDVSDCGRSDLPSRTFESTYLRWGVPTEFPLVPLLALNIALRLPMCRISVSFWRDVSRGACKRLQDERCPKVSAYADAGDVDAAQSWYDKAHGETRDNAQLCVCVCVGVVEGTSTRAPKLGV